MQQHAARKTDFRQGRKLGARDHLVQWRKPKIKPHWLSEEQYRACPDELTLRETRTAHHTYVTTLHNPKTVSKKSIANLYQQRWNIELDLRNIKTTLGMETLSCKTPNMNEKEMGRYIF